MGIYYICPDVISLVYELQENTLPETLQDAGMSAGQIKRFMELFRQRRVREEVKLLKEHRAMILAQLHVCQDELYCIDYMTHNIEKEL